MSDIISRSALLKHIDECIHGDCVAEWKQVIYAVRCQVVVAPAVDAVPVVRCKDCVWFGKAGCAIWIVDDSDKPREYDFCSYGERKDNGENESK